MLQHGVIGFHPRSYVEACFQLPGPRFLRASSVTTAQELGCSVPWAHPKSRSTLPVGPYHVPFFGYPILILGIYNHYFGYPKKGTWYEPTGRLLSPAPYRGIESSIGGHFLWHPYGGLALGSLSLDHTYQPTTNPQRNYIDRSRSGLPHMVT